MNNEFNIDDLRTGMRVIFRNGKVGIVLKDLGVLVIEDSKWMFIKPSDILTPNSDWEMMSVWDGVFIDGILKFNHLGKECLWKRQEKSQEQLKLEEMKATINELQKQANELEHKLNRG